MLWLLLFIPPIILIPYLGDFLFQPGSPYSDLLISHVPNAVFLQQTIIQWHTLPFWSPTILSGYPFAADPLSGLWYLPGWLTVLFPTAVGFNLAFILHLLWGGLGVYRFLRVEGLGKPAAVFGGLFFEFLPKVWAHYAAGHITLVYALAWTPWLLFVEKISFQNGPGKFRISPGIIWGIILLADVRWGAFAGVIWLGYQFYQRLIHPPVLGTAAEFGRGAPALIARLGEFGLSAGFQILLGIGAAAPLLFPLIQYSGLSTRSQMTTGDVLAYSLPPDRLLGLIFPDPNGSAEWTLYASEIGLLLFVFALAQKSVRRKVHFWLVVLLASLIFALGSAIPLMNNLAMLPGLDLLRVPARALFASGFSFVVIASTALDELLRPGRVSQEGQKVKPQLAISGVIELMILLAGIIWYIRGSLSFPIIWGVVWSVLAAIFIILGMRNTIPPRIAAVLAMFLLLIDLGIVNRRAFEPRNPAVVEGRASGVVSYLAKDDGIFRVYSPSYSVPQDLAARSGLSLADGVDPLQLRSYAQFMLKATGVPFSGYSVTIPPFHTGSPPTDNQAYLPDLHLLGLLNVKYLVSEYDLHQPALTLRAKYTNTRIYINPYARERAWVQTDPVAIEPQSRPVIIFPSNPNHFQARADGPGYLVLSEIQYPGWQVSVDGVRQPVETVQGIFRGVSLTAGVHEVDFHFQPFLVYLGLVFAFFAWLWVAFQAALRKSPHDLAR